MKFVHLADLHLDAKFDSLSSIDGLPQKRRLEQRKALKNKGNKVDFLVMTAKTRFKSL